MIRLNSVSTGYSRDKPLKDKYSFTFEDNMIYGILGESGCGKSTMLRTIAGLMKPLNGLVLVDGKPLKKAGKNQIYMMHQNYTSFNWLSCLENVLVTKRIKLQKINQADKEEALELLKKVGLEGYEDKYPTQLSGGMRQRLALARTLYMKPKVILMDEPLSALDEETRSKMQDLILDVHKETKNIIIMVTHSRTEAVRMCDEIIEF